MMADVVVVAINVSARMAVRADDVVGDIVNFLDPDGDETDDPEGALVAIVQWRGEGSWSPVEIADFEQSRGMH